jgi:muconolactone delta-isomerase
VILQRTQHMIAIARGSITEPDKLGSFIADEMRVVRELKDEGVMKALYRRAAGPGVVIILEGQSMDAIRERVDTLPFVVEGLMTVEYEEVYEI